MVVEGTIAEVEAVKKAGVSARTLRRFSEAGYLTVQVSSDETRFYAVAQLHEIFGEFQEPHSLVASTVETPKTQEAEEIRPSRSHDAATYYSPFEPSPMVEQVEHRSTEPTSTAPSSQLQEDYARLKNLVALQERILDMKEGEIQDLRSQRDWLKTRVEKLEEKGDRDQVLLLSETQALRQMIGLQQRRASTLRNLLEWLGLGSSETVPTLPSNQDVGTGMGGQGAIVVNKAANS